MGFEFHPIAQQELEEAVSYVVSKKRSLFYHFGESERAFHSYLGGTLLKKVID